MPAGLFMHYFKRKYDEKRWGVWVLVGTEERLAAVVSVEDIADLLLRALNGGVALDLRSRVDLSFLLNYASNQEMLEHFLENAELSGRECTMLKEAEDEDTAIWQLVCGRLDNDHAYARSWRLIRAVNGKSNGPIEEKQCNECGALIPQITDGSLVNKFHEESCPLYEEKKE